MDNKKDYKEAERERGEEEAEGKRGKREENKRKK